MDDFRKSTVMAKGGVVAAIIATLVALLTVGAGVAFGAEGVADLVDKTVGDLVGSVAKAAKEGETLLRGGSTGDKYSIPVEIAWNDSDDDRGMRPGELQVSLTGYSSDQGDYCDLGSTTISIGDDGVTSTTIEVDKEYAGDDSYYEGWVFDKVCLSFDCPQYYNVDENSSTWNEWVEGDGTVRIAYDIMDLSNVMDPASTAPFTVNITWDDEDDAYSTRPDPEQGVEVVVHDADWNCEYYIYVKPDGNGSWTGTESIPRSTFGGTDLEYVVGTFISGYQTVEQATGTGYDIVATLRTGPMEPHDLVVRWMDQNHPEERPSSFDVVLYANGSPVETKTASLSDALVDADASTWTFGDFFGSGLPAYQSGQPITYTIGVGSLSAYNVTQITENENDDGNPYYALQLTSSTHQPSQAVNVEYSIVWNDKNNANGKRPEYVDVQFVAGMSKSPDEAEYGGEWEDAYTVSDVQAVNGTGNVWPCEILGVPTTVDRFQTYYDDTYECEMQEDILQGGSRYWPVYDAIINYPAGYSNDGAAYPWYYRTVSRREYDQSTNTIKVSFVFELNRYNSSVTINWDDNHNAQGTRPESVAFSTTSSDNADYGITLSPIVKTLDASSATGDDVWQGALVDDSDTAPHYTDERHHYGAGDSQKPYVMLQTFPDTNEHYTQFEYSLDVPDVPGYSKSVDEPLPGVYEVTYTYTAPQTPIVPETSAITLNRVDDTAGIAPAEMALTEVLPGTMDAENVDTSALTMVIREPETQVAPVVNAATNALIYDFQMSDGQTASVNLVVGSSVSVVNKTSSVDLAKKAGDGTSEGQSFTVGTAPSNSSLSLTFGAAESVPQQNPADERAKGWIKVNTNENVNAAVSYEAFKVFDADVVKDGNDYKATHITWASDAIKGVVNSYISTIDSDNDGHTDYEEWLAQKYGKDVTEIQVQDKENPQNAAEWIAIKIADSDEDTTAGTTPRTTKGETFATQLATTLRNYGFEPTPVPANTVTPLDQGYYVVATSQDTIDDGEAGTAPIWAPVPATGYTVDEKVSVPTLNKQVRDNTDDTTNFNKVADASTGQWLDFKLTVTLPQNIEAFTSYPISIVDAIPAGMDATIDTENGFSVFLSGTDITDKVDASCVERTLAVSIDNVLSFGGVTGSETIVIGYRAKLNSNSVKGAEGNTNTATLTYPADPMVPETTGTLESSACVLTYQLQVDKVDEATRLDVNGAKFVAQTEVGGTTYWVAQDGSLTTTEAERGVWTTEDGSITIPGIDEGTYTLTEIEAPSLYETLTAPLVVTVDAVKDYAGGALTSLSASASGANGTLVSNPNASQDGVVGTAVATGVVQVRVSDVRQVVLPLTGMPVKTAGIIVGVALAIASAMATIFGRRNREDYGEE